MMSSLRLLSDALSPLPPLPPLPPGCPPAQGQEDQIRYARITGTDDDDSIHISQDPDANAIVTINGQVKLIPREKSMNLLVDLKKGNDVVVFDNCQDGMDNVIILGGEGNDAIRGPYAHRATIRGGDGDDVIMCDYAQNYVDGGKGNDIIIGAHGNDLLDGGEGNDIIHGGCGDDTLYGGQGKDIIYGSDGNDTAWAVEPGDTVDLGLGHNALEYIIATPIPPAPAAREEGVSF